MSLDNLSKFSQAANESPDLQAKIRQIHTAAARDTAEKIAALSVEAGLPFTAEEFLAVASSSSELSETDLDAVAGGVYPGDGAAGGYTRVGIRKDNKDWNGSIFD